MIHCVNREIFAYSESEMKSTRARRHFTRRKAYFTLRSNISPARMGGFR